MTVGCSWGCAYITADKPLNAALGKPRMNIFEEFKRKWETEELDVHPPKEISEIQECFRKFGVEPSNELIELYCTLDGMDCMDNECFRLWPLSEVSAENGSDRELERTKEHGVLFADYCINCWCYRVNGKGEVIIDYFAAEKEPEKRASSLLSFFQLMANDPDKALL